MDGLWRFLAFLTRWLNRLLVLAFAVAVIWDLVRDGGPETGVVQGVADWVAAEPVLALVAAAALVLLNLNVVQFSLYSLTHTPGRSFITSPSPGGRSRVALSAIQRALRATASQVPEIARARVRVARTGRHRYRVHVRYLVRDVRNAGPAAEHLRLVLKKRFSDLVLLDPKDRVEFDLDLAGIVRVDGAPVEPKKLQAPPDVVNTDVFKGPVYPVEGEIS